MKKSVLLFSFFLMLSNLFSEPVYKKYDDSVYNDAVTLEFSLLNNKKQNFCLFHSVDNIPGFDANEYRELFHQQQLIWCIKDLPGLKAFWIKDKGLIRAIATTPDWTTPKGIKVGDSASLVKSVYSKDENKYSIKENNDYLLISAANSYAEAEMLLIFYIENEIVKKIEIRSGGDINWSLYESQNYDYGNGMILFQETVQNKKTTIRKLDIEVTVGDMLSEESRVIFKNFSDTKIAGMLKDNDKIKLVRIATVENLALPKTNWGAPQGEVWYEFEKEGMDGTAWILYSRTECGIGVDPFYNGNGEILEEIESSGKKWTVRKLESMFSVWERLNVRDKPGLGGKKVFLVHESDQKTIQENYNSVEITEETEVIDGKNERWIKIEYKKGQYGWIFGGYATVERGGPKYETPENRIKFIFSDY